MKRIKYIIITIIFLLIPQIFVSAKNNDYEVDSYNIEVNIDSNYNYKYNESINLIFNKSNVIVTNNIPYKSTNIDVNSNYVVETNKDKLIKISSKNNSHDSYTYKYELQKEKNKKDIYIVDITNNFNNELNNINFIINFPQSFNKNNLEFYLNNKKINDLTYEIKDKEIIGNISNLKEEDTLTIVVNYDKLYLNSLTIISIITSLVLSLVSYILWRIYGKDIKYTIKKEKNIPSHLSPLDVSLIEDGSLKNEDAIPLLLYLANKGYLKIIEDKNNEFTIIREKEYDGPNYKEASFIRALFRQNMSVNISEYINALTEKSKSPYQKKLDKKITKDNLKERIVRAIKNVISISNSNEEKNKYFEIKSSKKKTYLLFSITIILVLVTSIPFIEINKLYLLPISVLFSSISLFILINLVETVDLTKKNNKIFLLIIFAIITLLVLLLPSFRRNKVYFIAFLIGIMSVTFILFLYKYMPRRTIHGTKLYSKIEGLKLFINEANKKELTSILEDNPNYLYNLLPYAYILNIEDIIFTKLKEFNVNSPSWYKLEDFTYRKLFNSINRLRNIVNQKDKDE